MKILGIETSCDDTAAAVVEAWGGFSKPHFSVLSNVSFSQVAIHKKFGGIVPNLASRAHLEKIIPTIKTALSISNILRISEIDLVAVTRGPGLMPSLLIGVNTARALAYRFRKSIIGVNHIEGHIYSNWLGKEASKGESLSAPRRIAREKQERISPLPFPALILVVSGGHTELVLMENYGKYKIIGRTVDDAAGEAFDKTARLLNLGFPGGPAIAAEAQKLTSDVNFRLPRPMINSDDYNFSFSGLKTAVLYSYQDLIKKTPAKKIVSAMADEVQSAIVDVLVCKTTKAAKQFNPKTILLAGGVSANQKLREEMANKSDALGIPLIIPDLQYTTDNAAMIAAAGYFNYLKKKPPKDCWKKIEANANLTL